MATATETEAEKVSRSQMWKHEDFVSWAQGEGLLPSNASQAQTISVFAANRNAYRRTDRYRNMVDSHREDASTAKAEAAEARKAERAAKAAEAAAEKPATKAAAKPAAAPAKATRKAKGTASTEDNPFG